jgi:transposase-like protein
VTRLLLIDAESVEAVRFKCPACKSYEWRIDKDEQWKRQPHLCPECGAEYSIQFGTGKPNILAASERARELLVRLREEFTVEVRVDDP